MNSDEDELIDQRKVQLPVLISPLNFNHPPYIKLKNLVMELARDELKNFVMVWISVVVSLCYCYVLSKTTKSGILRLVLTLPVVGLFLFLPLNLTSVHLTGTTSFFVSWLANFKLLLFSFGRGPLCSSDHRSISLPKFIAFACLPIKVRHHPPRKTPSNHQTKQDPSQIAPNKTDPHPQSSLKPENKQDPHPQSLNYLAKGALLALILKVYDFGDKIHPIVLWMIYFFHIYFMLELILVAVAAIARLFLGIELEPQFNEPLLSSSLQDFWGKRWNLMVTRILRPTVYEPVLGLSTRLVGRHGASLLAVLSTFVVSAAMHELIFYYLGRTRPTFEVSAFFLLHGACLCVEIVAKRAIGGAWKPPRVVSGAATFGFVVATGFWLFLPPMLTFKSDERALEEYAAVGAFVRNVSRAISLNKN